jgi:hypothetical protein
MFHKACKHRTKKSVARTLPHTPIHQSSKQQSLVEFIGKQSLTKCETIRLLARQASATWSANHNHQRSTICSNKQLQKQKLADNTILSTNRFINNDIDHQ